MLFSRSSAIAERPAMKTENLPPRRCAVASGSVKHPPYKVREIKNIFSGKLIGWSIYPDQIPAMRKTIKRVLASMVFTGDKTAHKEMANAVLMSIGLPNVADQQCRTKEPR
jgi:hypothetical protein